MVLLLARKALPGRHGWRDQCVSVLPSLTLITMLISPAQSSLW
jgi:hypothetical protein